MALLIIKMQSITPLPSSFSFAERAFFAFRITALLLYRCHILLLVALLPPPKTLRGVPIEPQQQTRKMASNYIGVS